MNETGVQTEEACGDGEDNDGDGWIDDADPDCAATGVESGLGITTCNNGADDDGDEEHPPADSLRAVVKGYQSHVDGDVRALATRLQSEWRKRVLQARSRVVTGVRRLRSTFT